MPGVQQAGNGSVTAFRPIKSRAMDIIGKEPVTMDELGQAVLKLLQHSCGNMVCGFAWDVASKSSVSNSHHAPEGGVTNWWGRRLQPDNTAKPTGYPGFRGRVWVRFSDVISCSAHGLFSTTLTHPGTGGFGGYDGPWQKLGYTHHRRFGNKPASRPYPEMYSWDYSFFTADWPGIGLDVEHTHVMDTISGRELTKIVHKFEWTDAATQQQDQEFLEESQALALAEKNSK